MLHLCDDIPIIEQLVGKSVASSVSPGYGFGRSGNVGSNTYLLDKGVPSNITGTPFGLDNGVILAIWCGSQNKDTYVIEVYEHEGDSINLTILASVTVTATRVLNAKPGDPEFTPSNSPTNGRQIACRVSSGSAKELKVTVFLGGT